MEADSHLGVANRLAAPLAGRVALAFPLAGRSGRRYLVSGRPVSRAVASATRTAGRRAFGIAARRHRRAGGRRAARARAASTSPPSDAFGDGSPIEVIHVAGAGQVDGVRELLAAHGAGAALPPVRISGQLPGGRGGGRPGGGALGGLRVRAGGRRAPRRCWCPTRTRPATTRPRTPAGWPRPAAPWCCRTRSAPGPRCAALVGALLADRPRLAAMADASRAAGPPGGRRRGRRRGPRARRAAVAPPPALRRGRRRALGPRPIHLVGIGGAGHERPGPAGRARPATG